MLRLDAVHVRLAGQTALDGIDLSLPTGEIGCLLGPSGCGKTTLLRLIAGFVDAQRGALTLAGERMLGAGEPVPPEQRRVGMVFQDMALFPHLDVAANIAFGLPRERRSQRRQRVAELLERVGLPGLGRRYPHQLSGGQQQRVALARAMAPRPRLLLLDEPFSALDAELREQISADVRAILRDQGSTALMVTHDQQEAFAMADRLGVMRQGRIQQWDTPARLYQRPANRFVAEFLGRGRFLRARLSHPGQAELDGASVPVTAVHDARPGDPVEVLIRPEDLHTDPHGPLRARVVGSVFRGARVWYTLALNDGQQLVCSLPGHPRLAEGSRVRLAPAVTPLVAFRTHAGRWTPDAGR
ncbi:ABC transporter ATP-binding protein (plasmid) [Alcanivorax sp. N3-2A]|nr:ABC transporter ATP-binding protein [Alcanivorax sp. N3-2A]ASK36823.1 ABC transporter ATP-binding protein [Alcanivorax sp. N3-2A]|tara:strand:- start:1954 stop:3021 length:1068 start_codon:yes stop_codon:yes gene_type:complete